MELSEKIESALKKINYPGFSKDIVTLGAVEKIEAADSGPVRIFLKQISGNDETRDALVSQIEESLKPVVDGAGVEVYSGGKPLGAAAQPAPGQEQGQPVFVRDKLSGVKQIIPVTSGKGGVGKSTVAVNLAYTLSQLGKKVGILDLDIFGPSIPKMLGINERLGVRDDWIIPGEAKGLKVISIGMAIDDEEAMIMRGPMVMKVLDQLLNHVEWGELDYLLVDLPPGTGDVPLSLVQKVAITGAVVVTTPQDISLIDVRRAISMYRQTQTHILGIVENMSYHVCQNCGEKTHIFGEGGGTKEAEKYGVPLLGEIPLLKVICDEADKGSPVFDQEKNPELAMVFENLARTVMAKADEAPEPATGDSHEHGHHDHGHDHGHHHGRSS
ncbi:MAG: Mrp/NBP35 family ATP-binding protein [Nitrospinota bacterium]|nr:Mrp/NBP35 family ATP-binding protein [Nitrospinota bacterium]